MFFAISVLLNITQRCPHTPCTKKKWNQKGHKCSCQKHSDAILSSCRTLPLVSRYFFLLHILVGSNSCNAFLVVRDRCNEECCLGLALCKLTALTLFWYCPGINCFSMFQRKLRPFRVHQRCTKSKEMTSHRENGFAPMTLMGQVRAQLKSRGEMTILECQWK